MDCGINGTDFEKKRIFDSGAILNVFSPSQRAFFAVRIFLKILLLFGEKSKNEKFLADVFEIRLSYPEMFLDPLGPYSRSDIVFLEEKKVEKSTNYK